jgi:hypothetical protein
VFVMVTWLYKVLDLCLRSEVVEPQGIYSSLVVCRMDFMSIIVTTQRILAENEELS